MKTMEQQFNDRLQEKQTEIDALKEETTVLRLAAKLSTQELIKQDTLSVEDIDGLVYLYPKWGSGLSVKIGALYQFGGTLYEVIQAHTTQADWTPDATPALWKSKAPAGVIPEWVQPTGAHDAYKIGDVVLFETKVYKSKIDANTWSPTDYPAGWELQVGGDV